MTVIMQMIDDASERHWRRFAKMLTRIIGMRRIWANLGNEAS